MDLSDPDRTLVTFLALSTGLSSRDIGVDLGTANTVLCGSGGELVVSEPSIVAVDARTGGPLVAGSAALELLGRDGIAAARPIMDGVIVDLRGTEEMLRHLIGKVRRRRRPQPRVIAAVAIGISDVQRRAVVEACIAAGAREARLIAKPIAAALGSGLPVEQPTGSMVLDIGAATSEVAMISLGAIVVSKLIPVGGQHFDDRIVTHVKRKHGVLIGAQTAEQIKVQIGSASRYDREAQVEILGRDMASETHKTVRLSSHEIRGVLERPLSRIIEATKETLTRAAPQLACDVMERGITLIGGSSLLHGLAERLCLETGTPAHLADSPRTCHAIGSVKSLEKQPTRSQSSARGAITVTAATAPS